MSYRLSKTAIIGPSYYMATLLFIFPYKFEKNHSGRPFQSSLVRTTIAAVIWISLLLYSTYYHWTSNIGKLYMITPLHTFISFFFPMFYSRNEIRRRLNASYLLLKETKSSNNITFPLLFIFSPFIAYVLMMVSFPIRGEMRLDLEFFALLRFTATFALKSSICSHCFATVFIVRDITRQLSSLHTSCYTSTDLKTLTKMLSCTYKQVDLISEAFGPFLALFIFSYTIFVLFLFAKLTYTTLNLRLLILIGVDVWSIVVLCASSQFMDFEVTKLLELVKKITFNTNIRRNEEHNKMLMLMMEETTLRKLLISVYSCFHLDLPLVLTLSNVIVTYLVILLELV